MDRFFMQVKVSSVDLVLLPLILLLKQMVHITLTSLAVLKVNLFFI